ncbi:DUF2382 domain-containing protein [Phormidium tenue FACHB-886]|nr:DUF2382 domain-containing protein [Phormidium tenue FACHB-886]
MALHKIKDFDPDYRSHFDGQDMLEYDLYSGNDKVGSIDDLLVDDQGNFRYFVINTGAWIVGKKVLLPIGRARINNADRRIYADGLTRQQVEALPKYDSDMTIDYDQEEKVRGVYRPTTGVADATLYDRSTYTYDRDPALYGVNDRDHLNLKLYGERLVANKIRRKTGEVAVGKRVETETVRASVQVEKERVVVERVTPTDATATTADAAAFQGGEVVRMEVYEETPDIRKEAFVREEVRINKEVDRELINVDETVRREELDLGKQGNAIEER